MSKSQVKILNNRERQHQEIVWPKFVNDLKDTGDGMRSRFMQGILSNFSTAAQNNTRGQNQNLAQRGVQDSGVGHLLRQNQRASEASSRAALTQQAAAQQQNTRMGLFELAQRWAPQPTSAPGQGQKQKSSSVEAHIW
jgi:hypothetical protein